MPTSLAVYPTSSQKRRVCSPETKNTKFKSICDKLNGLKSKLNNASQLFKKDGDGFDVATSFVLLRSELYDLAASQKVSQEDIEFLELDTEICLLAKGSSLFDAYLKRGERPDAAVQKIESMTAQDVNEHYKDQVGKQFACNRVKTKAIAVEPKSSPKRDHNLCGMVAVLQATGRSNEASDAASQVRKEMATYEAAHLRISEVFEQINDSSGRTPAKPALDQGDFESLKEQYSIVFGGDFNAFKAVIEKIKSENILSSQATLDENQKQLAALKAKRLAEDNPNVARLTQLIAENIANLRQAQHNLAFLTHMESFSDIPNDTEFWRFIFNCDLGFHSRDLGESESEQRENISQPGVMAKLQHIRAWMLANGYVSFKSHIRNGENPVFTFKHYETGSLATIKNNKVMRVNPETGHVSNNGIEMETAGSHWIAVISP